MLPKVYWSYDVDNAICLINRTPTKVLENIFPYEVLHGVIPDLITLRDFGCLSYATTLYA